MDDTEQFGPLPQPAFDLNEELAAIEADQRKIRDAITELQQESEQLVNYPLERVRANVGRWMIPRDNAIEAHYALVAERSNDIDFSPANYPGFDSIFTERYEGPGFFDPLHDKFPRYAGMRDNLATVRNFILQQYFPDNSSADQVRIQHLQQIASFLAEGLNNDRAFLGLVPVFNPFKPFIDADKANAPGGEGARYLYEKILEMQRQSNWTRPFEAITALFAGAPYGKWDLPPLPEANAMPTAGVGKEELNEKLGELADLHDDLDAKREQLAGYQRQSDAAIDLNHLGDQLLFAYYQIKEGAENLAAPVQREAIDIAHDILNKLKMKLGTTPVQAGMGFNPDDDNAAVGAAAAVGLMFQRMIGTMIGRGQDPMAIPGVGAAHQALGQLAYLAKLDALRMASAAGNTRLAGSLRGQLSQMRQFGRGLEGKTFGDLLGALNKGISSMRQRMGLMGMHVDEHGHDEHAIDGQTVGSSEASRAQTLNRVRGEQMRKQYSKSQKQQLGQNQSIQNAVAHEGTHAQHAMAQAQQQQSQQQQAQTGAAAPQGFQAPIAKVKTGVNGNVARQNLKAANQKLKSLQQRALIQQQHKGLAFAKVHNESTHTALPPRANQPGAAAPHTVRAPDVAHPPGYAFDPALLASLKGLGISLHDTNTITGFTAPSSGQGHTLAQQQRRDRDKNINLDYVDQLQQQHDAQKGRSR